MANAKSSASSEPCVRLLSSDKKVHKVARNLLKQSPMIETLIKNLGLEGRFDSQPPIKINVRSEIIELIVEWLQKHKNDDTPMIADCEGRRCRKVPKWDKDFFNSTTQSNVFELVKAAHHLNIKKLTDLCCKTIAAWMSNKNAAEIRSVFGLENDLTEEDLKRADEEDKILETCTCTPAHPTTRGFELRLTAKLKQMLHELDALDRQHDELMTEISNLNMRAIEAQRKARMMPRSPEE